MRLTGQEDTDIALDARGQPVATAEGGIALVSGRRCWLQDIWMEGLTEEGELIHEDEEGRWAYGFSLREFLNGETDEALRYEVFARIREKLTKREFIDPDTIEISMLDMDQHGKMNVTFKFEEVDVKKEQEIDLRIEETEVETEVDDGD